MFTDEDRLSTPMKKINIMETIMKDKIIYTIEKILFTLKLKDRSELENNFAYSISIANAYLKQAGISYLKHANILELGPGKDLIPACMLKSYGAKSVHIVDPFLPQFNIHYHPYVYKLLVRYLKELDRNADVSHIQTMLDTFSHENIPGLECSQEALEVACKNFKTPINICFSNAVLEHLYDPDAALSSLSQCMSPGAIGFHQVDFRDHRNFDAPLEFLLDRTPGMNYSTEFCVHHGNSWRPHEYESLWRKHGFEVLEFSPNIFAAESYIDDFMPKLAASNSIYSNLSREQCRVVSGMFTVKKI